MSQQSDKTQAEARGAELREELAITDQRRAEEEEAKAQQAVAAAQQEESKKERKRREAEERRAEATAEAERARERGIGLAAEPRSSTLSGARASVTVAGPEKPELHVAAAFAGAFLFARILKKIAE